MSYLIIKILLVVIVTIMGMVGGQMVKGVRRFGIPGITMSWTTYKATKEKPKWREYCLVLLAFILSMGYGENSWLRKLCKEDWITRIAYGLILSVPFLVLQLWVAPLVLALAWSVRAGGFKIYKDYDFLLEDLVRYFALGLCIGAVV